jgi:hypothetical protein
MQLQILEIIKPDEAELVISAVAQSLKLSVEYRAKRRAAFFKRWLNGKLVDEWIMVLTSEEFNAEVQSMLIKYNIKLNDKGFSGGIDSS